MEIDVACSYEEEWSASEQLSFRGMAYKGGSGKPGPVYLQSDIEELCASLWVKLLLVGVIAPTEYLIGWKMSVEP